MRYRQSASGRVPKAQQAFVDISGSNCSTLSHQDFIQILNSFGCTPRAVQLDLRSNTWSIHGSFVNEQSTLRNVTIVSLCEKKCPAHTDVPLLLRSKFGHVRVHPELLRTASCTRRGSEHCHVQPRPVSLLQRVSRVGHSSGRRRGVL